MRDLTATALILALLPGAVWAQDNSTPTPGFWELTSTATWVFSARKVEQKCLSAADVAKVLDGPSNRHYRCVYPDRVVGNGRIRLSGVCATKRGQKAQITVEGRYGADSFQLKGLMRTVVAGAPITVTATSNGRLISPSCPSPEPTAQGATASHGD